MEEMKWKREQKVGQAQPIPTQPVVSVVATVPVAAAVPVLTQAHPPTAKTTVPQYYAGAVDANWLAALFPTKAEPKRSQWLAVLLDNEFETLDDLKALDEQGWQALALPIAVKSTLRQALKPAVPSAAASDLSEMPPAGLYVLPVVDFCQLCLPTSARFETQVQEAGDEVET